MLLIFLVAYDKEIIQISKYASMGLLNEFVLRTFHFIHFVLSAH